ncbi:hypothetical protein SLA2020_013660 [Shorea laevis]
MMLKVSLILVLLSIFSGSFEAAAELHRHSYEKIAKSNFSTLTGIELPDHMAFNAVSSSTSNDCKLSRPKQAEQSQRVAIEAQEDAYLSDDGDEMYGDGTESAKPPKEMVKLHLKRRSVDHGNEPKKSVVESTMRDLSRIQTLHRRVVEKKNQNTISRLSKDRKQQSVAPAAAPESYTSGFPGQMVATLESGVSLGSGEYFIDVFIGTPAKHFPLILDTGSDLNWIQCVPCYDCFEQNGPYYDPKDSGSFRNISCHDERCNLVSSPDPPQPCKAENQTCPYYYWYGDSSNTTGDFALETFTVNLTSPTEKSEFRQVENVMFGCGHWNRGLFHGAAGLLGFGRGPLSFSSQLKSLYGHSFSYCLVDRNSNTSVSSKLIFGEDKDLLNHPKLNFTSLVADPAYEIIKEAFVKKIKGYPVLKDFPVLDPCYNVSGVEKMELPEFGILFADGGVWNFPVENYFIPLEKEVVCLAILGTPRSPFSIIGNYQQQNFHILYDTKKSRLGYAPMSCADV